MVLVDTDSLAKEIAGRPEHQETIASIIGCAIDINQSEDRARLAQKLFSDSELLKQYEAFIHPLVWNEVSARYSASPDQTIFVGSFDPPTRGHQWLITEALNRYDEVAIAVTVNSAKKSMFTLEERFHMLREIVPSSVSVGSFSDVYSVDYAESIGATVLVRGIRNDTDREYENVIARINSQINPSVRTEFLAAPSGLTDISSSMVKMMIGPKGWEHVVSHYVAPEVLVRLIAKHHNLFRKLEARGAHGNEIEFWKQLVLPYVTEPNRDYHNLAHISAMLAEFKTVESLYSDAVAVEYAIWMHDIVNDTMVARHVNEERSAERALRLAESLGLSQDFCEKVRMLILATKHDRAVVDGDAQLLVDMDLAILGANPRVFHEYEDNVRKEYAWMHEEPSLDGRATDVFNSRRLALLRAFYVRKHLYHTEHFRAKYEQAARRNLEASIQKLAQTIE